MPNGYSSRRSSLVVKGKLPRSLSSRRSLGWIPASSNLRLYSGTRSYAYATVCCKRLSWRASSSSREMVSSRSRTASVPVGAVSGACRVMVFLLLGNGAAASAELGDELARGTGIGLGGRCGGVGGKDLDVVEAAAPGTGAAVRDGGQHLAAEGGLEEV